MIDEAYRQRKIDNVTGYVGGSIWEINQVTFVAPVCCYTFLDQSGMISQNTGCGIAMGHLANSAEVL